MVEDAEFHFLLAFVLIHCSPVGAKRNGVAMQAERSSPALLQGPR
jgi:hypothetical protein